MRSLQTLKGAVTLRQSLLACGKSRGLSCLVISPAGTPQPPLWLAGLALLPALLQPSGPLATFWDGEGKGARIAPWKLARVQGFKNLVTTQAEEKGGGHLAALSWWNQWLSC